MSGNERETKKNRRVTQGFQLLARKSDGHPSETPGLTWVLMASNIRELAPEVIDDTLGIMVKYQDDNEAASVGPVRVWLK